jgi:hypothetical protein
MIRQQEIDATAASETRSMQLKVAEMQASAEADGNKKLLAKYKYDESPWLVRVCSSFSKLYKGELSND